MRAHGDRQAYAGALPVALSSCCSAAPAPNQITKAVKAGACCSTGAVSDPAEKVVDRGARTVDPSDTQHHAEYGDKTYHFRNAVCAARFVTNPKISLGGKSRVEPKATPGAM